MRIKKVEFNSKDFEGFGVKEFTSSKFNNTIALVGKNGSGKTRYLKAVEKKLNTINIVDLLKGYIGFIPSSLESDVLKYKNHTEVFEAFMYSRLWQDEVQKQPKSKEIREKFNEAVIEYNTINNRNRTRKPAIRMIDTEVFNKLGVKINSEVRKRVKFLKNDDFRALKSGFDSIDIESATFQSIVDSTSGSIEVDEFSMINQSALTFLKRLPNKLAFDDLDTKGDLKKFKNRVAYKRFRLLQKLIKEFLGKSLEWDSVKANVDEHDDYITVKTSGFWKLDGREFDYKDLSDGEKVLFTYALLLFLLNSNPRVKFNESIIIIDEPELNLHPKAQVQLINSLRQLIKDKGQLIIATHSLSIIGNLDYSSLFLVRDSQLFSPSSLAPYDSVDDLMGFDEHYNKVVEFLVSTPSWAMTNFMGQCFEDPDVFDSAQESDPQVEIFKRLLLKGENLSILDFGAGKGRLLEKVKESKEVWDRITNYDCFDIEKEYNDTVLKKGASNVINNLNDLEASKYDIIAVINVLHEIPIDYWAKSLNKIKKSLKPNGYLALIEDTELPVGELPNEHGFLILNTEEMKILLGEETSFVTPSFDRYKDRIVCGIIKGEDINRIDKNRINKTLNKLRDNSLKSIVNYRKLKDKKASLGRLYALKANLYVNSDLAMSKLEED